MDASAACAAPSSNAIFSTALQASTAFCSASAPLQPCSTPPCCHTHTGVIEGMHTGHVDEGFASILKGRPSRGFMKIPRLSDISKHLQDSGGEPPPLFLLQDWMQPAGPDRGGGSSFVSRFFRFQSAVPICTWSPPTSWNV